MADLHLYVIACPCNGGHENHVVLPTATFGSRCWEAVIDGSSARVVQWTYKGTVPVSVVDAWTRKRMTCRSYPSLDMLSLELPHSRSLSEAKP